MTKYLRTFARVPAVLTALVLLSIALPAHTFAATSPSLGAAATYGVLAGTYTNTTVTTINGDVGYTTGPATPPLIGGGGTIYGAGAPTPTARTDAAAALTTLNAEVCTETLGAIVNLSTVAGHTTGVYTPGVYCSTGAMSIGTAGITLSGAGTYIFRADGELTSVDNSVVTLANGASSCDAFWTPTAATTLGANTTFIGTIIDNANAITVGANTIWTGRALSLGAGVVTTDTNTITRACTTASVTSSGGTSSSYVPPAVPLISLTKIPSPLNLPTGPGSVTYTYTAINIGQVAMSSVWVKDDKCSPLEFIAGDSNSNSMLDLDEAWVYRCSKTVSLTETNTATAHGSASNSASYAEVWDTANATVIVGLSVPPPLINLVKIPNRFSLPYGGGPVTYAYLVTNPGTAPLSNVSIVDDKCTGLPGRVAGHPGDINHNNLLESDETWTFTCQTNIWQTTTNIATAQGSANGLTAIDFAPATVVVSVPSFPSTAVIPSDKNDFWVTLALVGILLASASAYIVRKKYTI